MTNFVDVIGDRSLGTSTAQIQLSGDKSGNATDYVVPTNVRSILAVSPILSQLTPTAGESVQATLSLISSDLNFGNCEMLAEPLGSALSTVAFQPATVQNRNIYPLNMNTQGGEHIQFYGQAQVANTVAPFMGATLYVSDQPIQGPQYFYLTTSKNKNSSNPTSSGTSPTAVAGQSVTISGQGTGTIRALYGVFASGTIVASDVVRGYFSVSAPEIQYVNHRWEMEPVQGFLGTTGQTNNYIARADKLSIPFKTPTTVSTTLTLVTAPANAGTFEVGIQYTQ